MGVAHEGRGVSPRRSRWLPPRPNEAPGFPGRPIRDARSAEWELMSALSLRPNVRGHGFQMHHYRNCAGDPLSRGFEPLSLAYFSLRRQREVSAAPHRGDANKPIRNQGKANTIKAQPKSAAQANRPSKAQRHRHTDKQSAAKAKKTPLSQTKIIKPPSIEI